MGKVMGILKPKLAGRADMTAVSAQVKKALRVASTLPRGYGMVATAAPAFRVAMPCCLAANQPVASAAV
jgi:hypothetical protein